MTRVSSKKIVLTGVFATLHAILYYLSFGLWRNWSIYLEPLEGIILGPWAGFSAALIGSIVARAFKPTDLWMFGIIAEPMGVLACGFLAKKEWKPLIIVYGAMLAAYFVHPFGIWLPLWTILDILVAFVLIYPVTKIFKRPFEEDTKRLPFLLPLIAFIGTVTDALTRVFLLVPVGLYALVFETPEVLYLAFVFGALDSYIEDALVVLVSFIVSVPLLVALRRIPGLRYLLS